MFISFRERRGITRYIFRIILIGKFPFKPEWTAVMHEVDDRVDFQFLDHVRNNLIGPAPIELPRFRFELIPRSAPAHCVEAKLTSQPNILAPISIMAEQLEFIERTTAVPRLRDKRVFDAG